MNPVLTTKSKVAKKAALLLNSFNDAKYIKTVVRVENIRLAI
jgi:hypothetical protein